MNYDLSAQEIINFCISGRYSSFRYKKNINIVLRQKAESMELFAFCYCASKWVAGFCVGVDRVGDLNDIEVVKNSQYIKMRLRK